MTDQTDTTSKNKVEIIDGDKNTKLHYACVLGNIENALKELEKCSKIDVENYLGWTPLMMACRIGSLEIVKLLLDKKADATKKNKFGVNVFAICVASENLSLIRLMLQHLLNGGVSKLSIQKIFSPLSIAVLFSNYEVSNYLIQQSFNINHQEPLTAVKFTFYIENLTPTDCDISCESTNFNSVNRDFKKPFYKVLSELKMTNITQIWDTTLQNSYGIVITPDEQNKKLKNLDVTQVDFWIYANTYGIYLEEIIVNFPEIPSFCFTLLVEIVGFPIEFPFSLNMSTKYPIIRFGHIPYKSKPMLRKLKVVNSSEVTVNVCFHVFLPSLYDRNYRPFNLIFDMKNEIVNMDDIELFLVHNKLGKETTEYLQLTPSALEIEKHSSKESDLCLFSEKLPTITKNTDIQCYILAYVYLNEEDRKKTNLFYRKTGKNLKNIKIEVLASIDLPIFKMDYLYGETKLEFYVNDLIYDDKSLIDVRLVFQNNNCAAINAKFHIMSPFRVVSLNTSDGLKGIDTVFVNPGKTLIVNIRCDLSIEYLFYLSELVFNESTDMNSNIDKTLNSITVPRTLNIHQLGICEQHIPMELVLFYPRISVEPNMLKFDNVLIDCTKKMLLVIKNLTASVVEFNVLKSVSTNVIRCSPNKGFIEKSTGQNYKFANVFVYFTPSNTESICEGLRISTNIPNYYIDVIVNGAGIYNEKFNVHHKI